mmetsp:Transcript_59298/g.191704  ORF Transcript_59298/g.191704 Transcript_59298/m.191704 type:complete len:93 (-) Transcript_59298:59-337(-)
MLRCLSAWRWQSLKAGVGSTWQSLRERQGPSCDIVSHLLSSGGAGRGVRVLLCHGDGVGADGCRYDPWLPCRPKGKNWWSDLLSEAMLWSRA